MISKTKSLSFQNYKDIAVKIPVLVYVYFCTPIFPVLLLFLLLFVFVFVVVLVVYTNCDGGLGKFLFYYLKQICRNINDILV